MDQSPHPRELEDEARYRAYLFGTPRLYIDGEPAQQGWVARRRAWEILVWFLLNPGKPAMAEALADQLWPGDDPERIASTFHVSLHALRRALEPGLGRRQESAYIRRHSNKVYSFDPGELWWTDVADLEQVHRSGHAAERAGDLARARFCYRRVAGYVAQGKLLDGEVCDWIEPYRRRYRQMCQQSLTRLMMLEAGDGSEHDLIEAAYLTLKIDPYNQLATKVIIENRLRSGRRPAAAEQLAKYCRSLKADLGVPVPDEIAALVHRVQTA
ncbi:AfsR/SARP family transcriptional regulator [Naumannella halotolerans]|uniref:DNA-binding SARP family transcriptional activator n=1 Tax=Naumannella halotolerans TaxID=993414 RepID=A0A4R7IZ59_9ACTN|nr:BTAD domain-containing putative transcriptional regulator [Naumannella halotolerans]TDT30081.1 DNA-binding SARP family transcriptional activator [Naumannella halotolerans]